MRQHGQRRHLLRLGRLAEPVTPCGTLGCPNPGKYLLGSKRQRFVRRFCFDCAEKLFPTGKYLMLLPKDV